MNFGLHKFGLSPLKVLTLFAVSLSFSRISIFKVPQLFLYYISKYVRQWQLKVSEAGVCKSSREQLLLPSTCHGDLVLVKLQRQLQLPKNWLHHSCFLVKFTYFFSIDFLQNELPGALNKYIFTFDEISFIYFNKIMSKVFSLLERFLLHFLIGKQM